MAKKKPIQNTNRPRHNIFNKKRKNALNTVYRTHPEVDFPMWTDMHCLFAKASQEDHTRGLQSCLVPRRAHEELSVNHGARVHTHLALGHAAPLVDQWAYILVPHRIACNDVTVLNAKFGLARRCLLTPLVTKPNHMATAANKLVLAWVGY